LFILIPQGGIGNRMMTIASCIGLAKEENQSVQILWHTDTKLNCAFNSLFNPIKEERVTLIEKAKLPIKYRVFFGWKQKLAYFPIYLLSRNLQKEFTRVEPYLRHFDTHKIRNLKGEILIQSSSKFYPYSDIGLLFTPKLELLKIIKENTKHFNHITVGLHIRRTDHIRSIKESPLELFCKAIDREIHSRNDVRFYLATDSYEEKNFLIQKYGDKILTRKNILERNSEVGIREAIIDLYTLSKTRRIYGSYYSSFSEVAAELGNIKLIQIRRSLQNI
jgi:hypothetical protein